MTNKIIGIRSGNQIIPYGAATKRTKSVTLTVKLVTEYNGSTEVTSPTYVTKTGYAYADSVGNWRLNFNFFCIFTSATFTSYALDITGVAFTASNGCAVTSTMGGAFSTTDMAGRIYGFCPSTTTIVTGISGDVALASEPTWAAANMEGAVNASVYIPAASATETGLVSTAAQTIAGVKTFSAMPALATNTPATAGAAGITGQIAWDASYIYVCVATNSWKRAGIAAGW